jgi:hypothetical protein
VYGSMMEPVISVGLAIARPSTVASSRSGREPEDQS